MLLIVAILLCTTRYNISFAFETKAKQAIMVDDDTGTILYSKDAYAPMPPSSMSKMMTVYVVFDLLKRGTINLEDKVLVSKKAWDTGGSSMFLQHNTKVSIEDLLQGIIIQSGNDASIAIAEGIFGDEAYFVEHMNNRAKKLNLKNTHFTNSTGLPDSEHLSTAYDLSKLASHLVQDFPEYYHYHAQEYFTYNKIKQRNRNLLLGEQGVDGIKTGHTDVAGYGIALSALRDGRRLVVVLNGLKSEKERKQESAKILNYGFNYFNNKILFKAREVIANLNVWHGNSNKVPVGVKKNVIVSVPKIEIEKLSTEIHHASFINAPIKKGQQVGTLHVKSGDKVIKKYKLIALQDVQQANVLRRFIQNASYMLGL